jgi:hypothetical protein
MQLVVLAGMACMMGLSIDLKIIIIPRWLQNILSCGVYGTFAMASHEM